jgi:DNA-binding NarL/FixJ family response regulator
LLEKGTISGPLRRKWFGRDQEMDREPPDVVVTDLQMPEMDGLQLVLKIAQDNPDIPVVLMTAHGSESIAAQALANGAASYVAKSDLAESLVNTVMLILAMNETDLRYRLIQCSTRTQFDFNWKATPNLSNRSSIWSTGHHEHERGIHQQFGWEWP